MPRRRPVTLEALEELAKSLSADAAKENQHLSRLVRAYAEILALRQPRSFETMPAGERLMPQADEAGSWNPDLPPERRPYGIHGPALVTIRPYALEHAVTAGGYFLDWKVLPADLGLYVDREGAIWGCEARGHERLGLTSGYPGESEVQVELLWQTFTDVTLEALREVEAGLRVLAGPLIADEPAKKR